MTEKIAYLILHEAKGRTAITGRTTHRFTLLLSSFATNNSFSNQTRALLTIKPCLLRLMFVFFSFKEKNKTRETKRTESFKKKKTTTKKERKAEANSCVRERGGHVWIWL